MSLLTQTRTHSLSLSHTRLCGVGIRVELPPSWKRFFMLDSRSYSFVLRVYLVSVSADDRTRAMLVPSPRPNSCFSCLVRRDSRPTQQASSAQQPSLGVYQTRINSSSSSSWSFSSTNQLRLSNHRRLHLQQASLLSNGQVLDLRCLAIIPLRSNKYCHEASHWCGIIIIEPSWKS